MKSINQILVGCKKSKAWAQAELFAMFSGKMYGICLYYTDNKEDAEDILHDGFMKIFDKIGQFDNDNLEAWMRKIFVNTALMLYRKRKFEVIAEDINLYVDKSGNFDMQSDFNSEELMDMISSLPPQYRLVFNLYALEGYKHKEIAEKLNISESTCKSNLSRARAILQEKLNRVSIDNE